MEKIKMQLIMFALQMFMKVLTPEKIKELIDKILDYAENYVLGTASDIDDKLVLPLTSLMRDALDIPDND